MHNQTSYYKTLFQGDITCFNWRTVLKKCVGEFTTDKLIKALQDTNTPSNVRTLLS